MASKLVLVTGASERDRRGDGQALCRTRRSRSVARPQSSEARRGGCRHQARRRRRQPLRGRPCRPERHRRDERADQARPEHRTSSSQCRRPLAALLETSAEEALAMIEVPYLAAFNLTRAVLPEMIARRSGPIACITSPGLLCRLAERRLGLYRRAGAHCWVLPKRFAPICGEPDSTVDAGRVRRGRDSLLAAQSGSREHMPKSNPMLAPVSRPNKPPSDRSGG